MTGKRHKEATSVAGPAIGRPDLTRRGEDNQLFLKDFTGSRAEHYPILRSFRYEHTY